MDTTRKVYTAGYYNHSARCLHDNAVDLGAIVADIRFSPHTKLDGWSQNALIERMGRLYIGKEGRLIGRYIHIKDWGNVNFARGRNPAGRHTPQVDGTGIVISNMDAGLKRFLSLPPEYPVILLCGCRGNRDIGDVCHRHTIGRQLERIGFDVQELDWNYSMRKLCEEVQMEVYGKVTQFEPSQVWLKFFGEHQSKIGEKRKGAKKLHVEEFEVFGAEETGEDEITEGLFA